MSESKEENRDKNKKNKESGKEDNKDKKIKLSTVVYSFLIIMALFLGSAFFLVYRIGTDENKFAQAAASHFPFPAVAINYRYFISTSELSDNLKAVKKFYESQDFSRAGMRVDFSTEDGKRRLKVREKQLLNKMVEDKAIEILARERGIKISGDLAGQNLSRKMGEYGSQEAIQKDLARLYGWNMEDFKEKIVKPDMYKDELMKFFFEENKELWREPMDRIEKAEEALEGGTEFSEVAKAYSEGATAQEGGILGWFERNQLLPELAEIAFSLEEKKTSEIVESELGYHIIRLEEKKSEDGEEMVRISQIFISKPLFSDWLETQMKNMKFFVPLRGYYWDGENLFVEFRDESLRQFEQDLLEKAEGDASVMF